MQEFNFQEFLPLATEFAKNHTLMVFGWIGLFVGTIYFFYEDFTRKYQIVDNQEAVRLMNAEDAIIVDLRSLDEFNRGHIVNSLILSPLDIKNQNLGKLDNHKEDALLLVDAMGVTGMVATPAAKQLVKYGFKKVALLEEGIAGWNGANLPLVHKHKK